MTVPQAYPKPGPIGGRLIRQVISGLREAQLDLPLTSHILIATSGGSDSVALAHLLARYGRRAAPIERLTLLHVNHGWRGEASDSDARFVEELGRAWSIPVIVHRLDPPDEKARKSESWEEVARTERKRIFKKESEARGAIVLTAHQADDLAETLLWRLLTGASRTHGGGISRRHGCEVRPLLKVRKAELQAYLKEEGQAWREDATNLAGRFLRSRMRLELMPVVERLFPRGIEHLVKLALEAQEAGERGSVSSGAEAMTGAQVVAALIEASGLRLRRPHWEAIEKQVKRGATSGETIYLPGGWRIRLDGRTKTRRWIVEATEKK